MAGLFVTWSEAAATPESPPLVTTDMVYVPEAALATVNEPVRVPSEIEHD